MNLREQILQAQDADVKELIVKEWGDAKVFLKSFTVADANNFSAMSESDDVNDLIAFGLVIGLCDEDGKAIFTKADIKYLNNKNSKVVMNVYQNIIEHNRIEIREDDVKN